MKDKSKLIAIILAIVTIVVVIVSSILNKDKKEIVDGDISLVSNYSSFYTVNSCLYRVITYLSAKDNENLLLLLNDEYEKNNNINKENILTIFPNVDDSSTFVSRKMYSSTINENLIKYYVEGYIEKNQIVDDDYMTKLNQNKLYFVVYLDKLNKTFSIEPYDGKVFLEGGTYEK